MAEASRVVERGTLILRLRFTNPSWIILHHFQGLPWKTVPKVIMGSFEFGIENRKRESSALDATGPNTLPPGHLCWRNFEGCTDLDALPRVWFRHVQPRPVAPKKVAQIDLPRVVIFGP